MTRRQGLHVAMICLVLFLVALYFAETAYAAGDDIGFEEKKGIEGLLKKKSSADDPRAPNKTQKFVGVASFFVMIVVVKYL